MNKPAPKEPSMDEILSSIRQIIADDDAVSAPRRPVSPAPAAALRPAPVPTVAAIPPMASERPTLRHPAAHNDADDDQPDFDTADAPLALSPEQIVGDDAEAFDDIADETLDEQDEVAFSAEDDAAAHWDADPSAPDASSYEPEAESHLGQNPAEEQLNTNRARSSVAHSAPMPDPTLSRDIAEQVIETTTDAAIRHTFTRLNELAIGAQSATIEGMLRESLRELLRPMLTDWLDENLPTIVEHLVEKEIARISRGVE